MPPDLRLHIRAEQPQIDQVAGPNTDTGIRDLDVHDDLLEGGRHLLIWEAGPGEVRQIEPRLAGNVLIWIDGGRTFRLEGGLNKGEMVELGRQITR